MPIYEYLCAKCNHEFEREQRITDDPVKTCPKCRSRKVKKLISQTSFVLKGGGWYSDLYSSPGKKKDDATGDGAAAGSSTSSDDTSKTSDDKSSKKTETPKKEKDKPKASGKKSAA